MSDTYFTSRQPMNKLVAAERGADGDYPPSPGMNIHPDIRLAREKVAAAQ